MDELPEVKSMQKSVKPKKGKTVLSPTTTHSKGIGFPNIGREQREKDLRAYWASAAETSDIEEINLLEGLTSPVRAILNMARDLNKLNISGKNCLVVTSLIGIDQSIRNKRT